MKSSVETKRFMKIGNYLCAALIIIGTAGRIYQIGFKDMQKQPNKFILSFYTMYFSPLTISILKSLCLHVDFRRMRK